MSSSFWQRCAFALPILFGVSLMQPVIGHFYGQYVARVQPSKAATFEMVWETEREVPLHLIQIPLPSEERNIDLLPIPWLGSIMYGNYPSTEVVGIKDATRDWTPAMVEDFKAVVALVHYAFRIMAGLGFLFIVLSGWGVYLLWRGSYAENRTVNRLFLWLVAAPWVATILGWVVTEVGRQPWSVYGLMLSRNAVSANVTAAQVIFSLGSIFVFYAVLLAVEYYLLVKFIKRGPIDKPFENRG